MDAVSFTISAKHVHLYYAKLQGINNISHRQACTHARTHLSTGCLSGTIVLESLNHVIHVLHQDYNSFPLNDLPT